MSTHVPAEATLSDAWCRSVLAKQGESRFVDVAGGRIHYLAWERANTRQPVLMLVHGMRGHAHWWDIIAPYFADDYKVLAIDLSGMGDSTRREVYDNDTFTRDIAGVIEQESSTPITIFGHSFGGGRTVLACATRPDLFRHAVVIDSPVWMMSDDRPLFRRKLGGRIYPDRESALARFRLEPEQPVSTQALRKHIAEHSLQATPDGWSWKFDLQLANARTLVDPATFDRIRTPLDFVCGELSSVVSKERAHRIAGAIKTARRPVFIPEAYHHLMLDQPLALVSTLRALLATM